MIATLTMYPYHGGNNASKWRKARIQRGRKQEMEAV
jgi:hypothetical protein